MTGRTPHQVLTAIRMDHAKRLLRHSGMSIGEIAESVGFDNVFHFSRQFKRQLGATPTAFRKSASGG